MTKRYEIIPLNGRNYVIDDKEIPYNPNGGTNGIFLCLHELEHPEDAIVKNVGNCTGCRNIVASNDPALASLPTLPIPIESSDVEALSEKEFPSLAYQPERMDEKEDYDLLYKSVMQGIKIRRKDFEAGWKAHNKKGCVFTEKNIRNIVNSVLEFTSHHEPEEFDDWFEKKLKTYNKQPKLVAVEVSMTLIGATWCTVCKDYADMECLDKHIQGIDEVRLKPKIDDKNNLIITKYIYE